MLIPARNEERVIAHLIDALRKQNYPRELFDIVVTANNCTDRTAEIARAAGKTIPEIFAQEGEAGFRARETAALERALAREDGVIATGGGIVTRAENIRMMREKGFVVWLCRPLEDMIADVRQDTRPNLAGDKAERMRTLYGRRERLYAAAAHLSFDNRMPPEEAAKALQKLLTE